ncbi:MAG: DUF3857 domain-containing transglutaminase family protein [Gammaproteobacteria bacterium]|nr:DUF3857 domain-containing transglutaminase family protein [Gammaproteobacteria bacterium]
MTEFVHIAYVPVTETGLEDAASISIDFHPQYQALQLHSVAVTRNGIRSERLDPTRVKLIQQERDLDKLMYNGAVTALTVLDDVRVGDVIEYSYSVTGFNPVFGDKFFAAYPLGWQVGVDQIMVRLLVPQARQLNTRVFNIDLQPQINEHDGMKDYRWVVAGLKPQVDEGDYPQWYNPYPWIQVSEYRDWHQVAQWAAALFKQRGVLSPALQERMKQWRRPGTELGESIQLATRFVQDDVRYFGVEMGQSSHRPSHPNEVVERRFGDCKDKALLLTSILRQWGVKAEPALVSAGNKRAIADYLPSPGLFDHVIVRAEPAGGKPLWIDATSTYQRGALELRSVPNYGKALLVSSASHTLADMQLPPGYAPEVKVEEHFQVTAYDKPVGLTVTSVYTRGEAEWKRAYFANKTPEEVASRYLNFYANIYPGIEQAEALQVNDDEEKNVITVVERYLINDYWEHEPGKLYSTFYGSTVKDYISLPRIINRKSPLAMTYPLQVSHTAVLEYPEEINFKGISDDVRISDDAVDFSMHSSYSNRQLKVQYVLASKQDAVLPENMVRHMGNRRNINDILQFSTWITDQAYFANLDSSQQHNYLKKELTGLVP